MKTIGICLIAPLIIFFVTAILIGWVSIIYEALKSKGDRPIGILMILAALAAIGISLIMAPK